MSVVSDYRYRGVSLSDRQAAAQAAIAYDHVSGWYAGGFGSSTRIGSAHEEIGFQMLVYGGYASRLSSRSSWEAGVLRYAYPESREAREYDFTEVYAGLASGGFSGRVFHSPDYLGFRQRSWYLQGAYVRSVSDAVSLYAQGGVLWLASTDPQVPSPAFPRRADLRFGIQYTWRALQFDLALAASDIPNGECAGGRRQCEAGVVFGVSYLFP